MNVAFQGIYNEGTKIKHCSAWQCYYCSNHYGRKDKFDRNFENCTGHPGYIYNFNMQSVLSFEQYLKYKVDIPLIAYIDFETTTPTDECLDPENRKMSAVSHVMILAFHSDLDIDWVIIEPGFGHSRKKLTSLNYLTRKQFDFKDNNTLLHKRDCALAVAAKNSKIAISEIFTTELKFAVDCLLKCFFKKFKSNNLELSNDAKRKYEIEHPIDWSQDRCCICTFLLEINPTSYDADKKTMSYADFTIFKEYTFLRIIFSKEELAKTDSMKDVKTYKNFVRSLKIVVFSQNAFNTCDEFDESFNDDLLDFYKNHCADCSDFNELKEIIGNIKI